MELTAEDIVDVRKEYHDSIAAKNRIAINTTLTMLKESLERLDSSSAEILESLATTGIYTYFIDIPNGALGHHLLAYYQPINELITPYRNRYYQLGLTLNYRSSYGSPTIILTLEFRNA